jgi:suppressor for copper-sensitivity B
MCVFVLTWLAGSTECHAKASAWAETEHGAVRLISATDAVGTAETVSLGLQFRMRDGWKIYWRNPGDAGYPPQVDWTGSTNLAKATLSWPMPARFSVLGLETIGYEKEVVLPISAQLIEAGQPLALRASVDYLTCSDICVPHTADLSLALPVGAAQPSALASLISRYAGKVPGLDVGSGIKINNVEVSGSGTSLALRLSVSSQQPLSAPDVFIEGPEVLAFGAPQTTFENDRQSAVLTVPVVGAEYLEKSLAGSIVTVTLVDGDRGAEQQLTVAPEGGGRSRGGASSVQTPLLVIIGLALVGGLILNLMPCVLPVLSIKLVGVIGHGGNDPRVVRMSFIASALGILFSFMVLATVLAALKSLGGTVGWGLQFQQPWFLTIMILVMVLFACNLWGFFEVRLPQFIADAGIHPGHVHGLGGHFLTGALATLLATPCSAPFVGTAIGFALSRGVGEIFVVFAALGLGLATPYLAVAAIPKLATKLPRPGPWIIVLRRTLGFALAATGVWLLVVLAGQVGKDGGVIVGGLAVALAAATYLTGKLSDRAARLSGWTAVSIVVAAILMPLPTSVDSGDSLPAMWVPLDEKAIPALVADGRIVFVNVTADWCITCKVNEKLVLSRGEVRDKLSSSNIVAMRGDWTRPSERISLFLARFGRYGIPFDAVYGPGVPDGEALPELLTSDAVLTALDRAANGEKYRAER